MLDHDYTAEMAQKEANLKIPGAESNCSVLLKELYTPIMFALIKQLSLIWKFRYGHKLTLSSGYMKGCSK